MTKISLTTFILFFIISICHASNIICEKYYLVKEGDYCDKISVENGISTRKLVLLNKNLNLNCDEDDNTNNLLNFEKVCIQGNTSFSDYINVSMNGRCGNNYGHCPSGQCCSKHGYCGLGSNYCKNGCQSEFGYCEGVSHSNNNRITSDNPNIGIVEEDEELNNKTVEEIAKKIIHDEKEFIQFKKNTVFIMNQYKNVVVDEIFKNFNINTFHLDRCQVKCSNYFENFMKFLNDDTNNFNLNTLNEILKQSNEPTLDEKSLYNGCMSQCFYLDEISHLYKNENINDKISTIHTEMDNYYHYELSKTSLLAKDEVDCSGANVYKNVGQQDGNVTIYKENKNNAFLRYSKWSSHSRIDGCSIPTSLGKNAMKKFLPACNGHDVCYNCGDNKSECDDHFYDGMATLCESTISSWRVLSSKTCITSAGIVKAGVVVFGQIAFDMDKKWRSENVHKNTKDPIQYCACSPNDIKYLKSKLFLIEDDSGELYDYY